jgi:hypothetical protein
MALYNDTSAKFSSQNLNSVGSEYGSNYGHDISKLIEKVTNRAIFDAQPKQFLDLKFLNMFPAENVKSDEFFYKEAGYQREPIVATANSASVTYPSSQTVSVQSMESASTNVIVVYPNGTHGTITAVNTATGTIEVTPYVGASVPAIVAGEFLCNLSTVDADGAEGFATHFRMSTIERSNYIQEFNMAIRYNRMELFKMKNAGTTDNFLSMENEAMFQQHRIGLSNAFWIGKKGEVVTKNGLAKTTGGIHTSMIEAGSPRVDVTTSTLVDGFEEAAFASEFGAYGDVRFAYMTPRVHRLLSNSYKEELTRYGANDERALLNLKEVNIGSSRIVLVPYKRFEDTASFPSSFANKIVIVDHKNIKRCQTWGEMSGVTDDLTKGTAKRYTDSWVETNMGIKFNNPLGCAEVNINGL